MMCLRAVATAIAVSCAVLWTGSAAWAAWPNSEQRCDQLGGDCYCSEPLDSTSSSFSGDKHDPPESSSKECNGGNTIWYSNGWRPTAFVGAGAMTSGPYNLPALPSGASVGRVLVDAPFGQFNVRASQGTNFSNQTWCARHYLAFSSNFSAMHGSGDRAKLMRNTGGSPEIHHETEVRGGAPNIRVSQNSNGWSFNGSFNLNTFNVGDVRGRTWVRMEMCYDHNPSTKRLNARFRHVRLDTGQAIQGSVESSNSNGSAQTGTNTWIIDGYRHDGGGPLSTNMYTGFSAAMATKTGYDPNFWIGPAAEIEGNLGGPPPASLDAPQLD